jgi:hypothetical protein
MKMNLTLIALATAAVFDASDFGNSHSLARDAGLGCSGLMLKSIIINKAVPLTEAGLGRKKTKVTEVEDPLIEVFAYESLKALLENFLRNSKSGGSLIAPFKNLEDCVAHSLELKFPIIHEALIGVGVIDLVISKYIIIIGTLKEPHYEDLLKAKTRVSKELKKAQKKLELANASKSESVESDDYFGDHVHGQKTGFLAAKTKPGNRIAEPAVSKPSVEVHPVKTPVKSVAEVEIAKGKLLDDDPITETLAESEAQAEWISAHAKFDPPALDLDALIASLD